MRANHHKVVGIALIAMVASACNTMGGKRETDGAQLFADYCAPCHGAEAHGTKAVAAPSLAGLPAWYVEAQFRKFREGVRGAHFDDIAGMRMRPMARTLMNDEQIVNVAEYIGGLPPYRPESTVEGDATKGAAAYATCAACHGADGMGMQSVNAPPLVYASDWYLVTQLHNFKVGIRGREPRDTTGATMAPMAGTLVDDAAIHDVVAYIASISPAAAPAAAPADAGHQEH